MHRFLWDLHYPRPDSLQRQYPISAIYQDTPRYPLGPSALPGNYNVKLTVDGKSYTRSLTVKMDPRVNSSTEDLHQQFELGSNIAAAMHHDFQMLQQVRGLREQLRALKGRITPGPLLTSITALDNKVQELEGVEESGKFLSTPGGRSLARLNTGLTTLLESVDSADAAPTGTQVNTFSDVKNVLDQQLASWEQIKSTDVPQLNSKLKEAGRPPLNPESAAVIEQEWHSTEKAAGED
jgi:hypothetical protein